MPRFSIRSVFVLILFVSIACAVLFAFPDWLQILTLFVSVLSLPGPLLMARVRGGPLVRSFALGGLVGYTAWFILLGIPLGFALIKRFGDYYSLTFDIMSLSGKGPMPISVHAQFATLYAPWCVVLMSGAATAAVAWAAGPDTKEQA